MRERFENRVEREENGDIRLKRKEEMEETERKREKGKIKERVGERENRRGGIASDDSRGQSLFTSPCRHLPLCKVIDAPACL